MKTYLVKYCITFKFDHKKIEVNGEMSMAEGTPFSYDDIDEMIETLRKQKQSWEVCDRAAASEDMVNIDYVGLRGGEDFEGGSAQGTSLVLGSERMIPGFESGIEGKFAGDVF